MQEPVLRRRQPVVPPTHRLLQPLLGGDPALRRLPQRLQDAIAHVLAKDKEDDDSERTTALRTIASFLLSKKTPLRRRLACIAALFAIETTTVYVLAFVTAPGPVTGTESLASTLAMYPDVLWDLRSMCQALLREASSDDAEPSLSLLIPNNDVWWHVQRYCCETQNGLDVLEDLLEVHQQAPRAGAAELCSLAFLRSQQVTRKDGAATAVEPDAYNHAIQHVAYYFADRAESDAAKLKAMSFLIGNTSEARLSLEFVRQLEHIDTSQFHNERSFLLWELRALCLHQQERQETYDGHVLQAANVAAECITDTAAAVTNMLRGTTQIASHGLATASRLVVEHTEPGPAAVTSLSIETSNDVTNHAEDPPLKPQPSPAVAMTGAVHRATDQARTWTAAASRAVKTQAAQHLHAAATRVPVPPQHATTIRAATHVAMACIGATATVGEALFVETGNVCTSATEAVSSIVQHKCGDEAGEMTRHVGSSVGNVVRTAAHVTLFTSGSAAGVSRSVVKSTGKWHIMQSRQKDDDGEKKGDDTSKELDDNEDDLCSVAASVGQCSEVSDDLKSAFEELDIDSREGKTDEKRVQNSNETTTGAADES